MKLKLLNWIAYGSFAVGILALFASLYFYEVSNRYKEPIFYLDTNKTIILSTEGVTTSKIKVVKLDGQEITSNIYCERFYFWNNGKEPIKKNDILQPINIYVNDSSAEILDFKLLNTTRTVCDIKLLSDSIIKNGLVLTFNILENKDGLVGQVIYQSKKSPDLKIRGIIEGVKSIGNKQRIPKSTFIINFIKEIFVVLLIIGLFYGVKILSGLVEKRAAAKKAAAIKSNLLEKKLSLVEYVINYFALIAILVLVLWGMYRIAIIMSNNSNDMIKTLNQYYSSTTTENKH